MNEEFRKLKGVAISFLKTIAIPLLIASPIIILLAAIQYFIDIDDGSYKKDDKKNTPYVVEQHVSSANIGANGEITTAMTAQELWDKMIEDGTRVDQYLKSPEELQRLITAQTVTDYLDTRSNPDEPIDWDSINKDVDSKKAQGIIKLKRSDENGNVSLMTYADPETFQSYIDEYNKTGSETAKQSALSHFTLEKGNLYSGGGNYKRGTDGTARKIEKGDVIEIPQGQGYGTSYTYNSWQLIGAGKQLELRKQAGMTFDEEDFGRINGRYAVAVTPKFGAVGDYIDYYYRDNNGNEQIIPCIICDIKGSDAENEWGHHGGTNVIEFYVNEETWCTPGWARSVHPDYSDCGHASSMHENPGTASCHPEWAGTAIKIINGGSYFDDPNFVDGKITSNNNSSENTSTEKSEEKNDKAETDQDKEATEITDNTTNTERVEDLEHEPLKWPTNPDAPITSYFGPRASPTAGASSYHQGIDIGVGTGTEVYATESGTVVNSDYNEYNGNWIKIDHGNGFESLYLHNSQLLVSVGDAVAKGQVIAYSGSTGIGTGPHLHFAIKLNGNYIDPLLYLYDNGKGNGTGGFGSAINVDPSAIGATSGSAAFYAKVATWNEVTKTVTSDDPEQEKIPDEYYYGMTTTRINYQQLVSGYKMPFDYLWALLVISQDKDFVFELADLVYNSEIEITVYDNLTENTTIMTDTYTRATKVITRNDLEILFDNHHDIERGGPFSGEKNPPDNYTTTTTVVTKTNTLNIAVTKADVWIVNYSQEFEKQLLEPLDTSSNMEFEDEEYPSEDSPNKQDSIDALGFAEAFRKEREKKYLQTYTDVKTEVKNVWSKYYYKTINRTVNNSSTTKTTKYISSPAVIEEKTDKESDEDNFVTIYIKNSRARNNINSASSWLFEILENSDDTKDMIDLTKYLMYKATERSFGVEEFDFSAFDPKNFKKLGSQYGGTSNLEGVAGQVYDFLLSKGVPPVGAAAVLGNIDGESGFNPAAINPESGASGLCQWYKGRLDNLKTLANSKGVDWTDVDVQLEHMWRELEGGSYPLVYNTIMNATDESDLEYAVWVWGRHFEVYFIDSDFETSKNKTEWRYNAAQKYYEEYKTNNSQTKSK